jgi:hypothetical protein
MGVEHTQSPTWYGYHNRPSAGRAGTSALQAELVRQLCSGQVLTQFNEQLVNLQLAAKLTRTTAVMNALVRNAGESDEEWKARCQQVLTDNMTLPINDPTPNMLQVLLRTTIKMVCPYKALEKQKCFMRRKMRKPNDMRI